jgi:cell division protein ZapE
MDATTAGPAPDSISARGGALFRHLAAILDERGMVLDAPQVAALERLQQLHDELVSFRDVRRSRLRRLIARPQPPRGLYLHGGVGRGKSFLMDAFSATVPLRRKVRLHFHAFMRGVHAELATLRDEPDPLRTVAARIAKRYRLICFDEFHVSDIADAMILARLLGYLFASGVVFVMTSNYHPEALYPNGLQRERLLPAIALLEEHLDVVEVDAGTDYRLRALEQISTYYTPLGPQAERAMASAFERMKSGPEGGRELAIEGRIVPARRVAGGTAWFDFAALCEGPRSQLDYLELAQRFHTILVSGIPELTADRADVARRFTWLVDVLYDCRVKLIASAAAPADRLVTAAMPGRETAAREFVRTASRLIEMQSHEYMGLPHLPATVRDRPASG